MICMSKAICSFSVGQYVLYCLAAKNITELKRSGHCFASKRENGGSWLLGQRDMTFKECATCCVYWVNLRFKDHNSINTLLYIAQRTYLCIAICISADGCVLWQTEIRFKVIWKMWYLLEVSYFALNSKIGQAWSISDPRALFALQGCSELKMLLIHCVHINTHRYIIFCCKQSMLYPALILGLKE